MTALIVVGGLALLCLGGYVYVSLIYRLRHSVDSLYTPPDDLLRADDNEPPPEPDTAWLNNT